MSKSKYSPEFRAMVAQEYINRVGSLCYLADKYQFSVPSLLFTAQYQLQPRLPLSVHYSGTP